MNGLRYTLISDGSSDRALIPILNWLLNEHRVTRAIQPTWADLGRLPRVPKTLPDKIEIGLLLYPCDLLFVHRDAEREPYEARWREVGKAIEAVAQRRQGAVPVCVSVIPVRMQEAWLLFDEEAIRWAAGNPNGRFSIKLPRLSELERLSDPKTDLYELLREASGLLGRRRKQFPVDERVFRVADRIRSFAPLRELSAFNVLENEIERIVNTHKWNE